MRADLNKQLCERERRSSTDHYKHYRRLKRFNPDMGEEGENLPQRESMTARYQHSRKDFSENFNPLWGAVRVSVGKSWNDFYSEFCKHFDKRSVINQHVLQHLNQFVERDLIVIDGELYIKNNYGYGARELKGSTARYYVDPRDGILKLNAHYQSHRMAARERAKEAAITLHKVYRKIDEDNVLRLIDSVWFHYTLKEVPEGKTVYEKPADVNEFRIGYGKVRTWEQLAEHERARFGKPNFVGGSAHDIFTGDYVYRQGSRLYALSPHHNGAKVSGSRYHASRRTASRKILKSVGL